MDQEKTFLTTKEAAKLLSVSEAALSRWRKEGNGPPYYALGSIYRYDIADLQKYLEKCKINPGE